MKKNRSNNDSSGNHRTKKCPRITLTFFLMFSFCCCFTVGAYAQMEKVNLSYSDTPVKTILNDIEKQSNYFFIYNHQLVNVERHVNIHVKNTPIKEVLNNLFSANDVRYEVVNRQIVLSPKNMPSPVSSSGTIAPEYIAQSQARNDNTANSHAQAGITIRGTVSDETGTALPGAVVNVKGSPRKPVITDIDGKFELPNVEPNATLVFSFLGFETIEFPVNNRSVMDVQLKPSVVSLDEVVVTGYSTKTVGEITGSVQKVSSEELANTISSPDIASLLKGRTTGFYVSESANGVRSQSNIVIRGQSTIMGEVGPTSPLVVLDGVIMGNVDITSLVNSNDIASVTLLKDAASTAIYGSRAALGVIVITTHKGAPLGSEKISVGVSIKTGISRQQNLMPLTNTEQWIAQTDRYLSSAWDESPANQIAYPVKDDFIQDIRMFTPEEASQYYNWQKEVFGRTGNFSDLNVNFRAGSQKVSLYGGAGWYRESGIRMSDKLNRMNFKLNADIKFAPWISAGFHTSVVVDKSSIQNGVASDLSYLPFLTPKDQNGNWNKSLPYRNYPDGIMFGTATAEVPNPVYEKDAFDNTSEQTTINGVGSFNLRLAPIKGLDIQTTNSIIYNSGYSNSNYDSESQSGKFGTMASSFGFAPFYTMMGADMHGALIIGNSQTSTFLTSNTIQYTKNIGQHKLSGLAGQEYSKTWNKNMKVDYYDILPGERNPAAAKYFGNYETVVWGDAYKPEGGQEESALFSLFGQIDYNYDQRYMATASIRTDASPSFGKNKRYGTFYSLSGAWQLKHEAFLKDVKFLDMLKLRYAYGTSGRNLGGVFLNKTFYSNNRSYNGTINSGSIISQLGNPDIGWETTYNHTLGVDFGLFNRINGAVDLYHKRSADLIQEVTLPATQGGFSQQQNVGEVVNKGVEVMIQADIIKSRNFRWSLGANCSFNKNEITTLAKDSLMFNRYSNYYLYEGESLNTIKAIPYTGVNPDNGAPLFEIVNAQGEKILVEGFQGVTDYRNYRPVGSSTPKYFGGFQSTWTYKNFSLSTDWYFQCGFMVNQGDFLTSIMPGEALYGGSNLAQIPSSVKIWSGPGDRQANIPNIYSTKIDMVDINNAMAWDFFYSTIYSSVSYQDGSHLRLRNVKLSYDLPALFAQKCYMQSATVYLSVDNLFVLKKSGFWTKDPDGAMAVINPLRVVFGLNINF